MKLLRMEKVGDGKFLKNYELTYLNKAGREKKYEMVSRRELSSPEDLGQTPSGVSIVAVCQGKMLLLHEFRMGINRNVYNLCAGMLEEGESVEDCIQRELYEETGLSVKQIRDILPASFAAVAFPMSLPISLSWKRRGKCLIIPRKMSRSIPAFIPGRK